MRTEPFASDDHPRPFAPPAKEIGGVKLPKRRERGDYRDIDHAFKVMPEVF